MNMRIVFAVVFALGSITVSASVAGASDRSDCEAGDEDACERYAEERCIRELRDEGFSRREARRLCRT